LFPIVAVVHICLGSPSDYRFSAPDKGFLLLCAKTHAEALTIHHHTTNTIDLLYNCGVNNFTAQKQ